jgi:uncharacterized protein YhfF
MIPELPRMDDLLFNLKQKGYEVSNRGIKIGSFGDSVELSSKLLELIRDGVKTATASLVWEWEAEGQTLPAVGDAMIVLDSDQEPVMVIEYVDVAVKPFSLVTEDFAGDEGEGDRSLASWRKAHWTFFTRACHVLGKTPATDMPIVCARFRVVFDTHQDIKPS